MSKFIVVKKNILIFIAAIIILFIISSLILIKFIDSKSVATVCNDDSTIIADFNGDGIDDKLTIDKSKDSYCVRVNIDSKEFILTPNDNKYKLGSKNNGDTITVTVADISRDLTPEIIISTYINKETNNHVFKYLDSTFKNIISTSENIIGIINSHNSKTPMLVSLSSSIGDDSSRSFIIKDYKIKDISFDKLKTPGLSIIQQLIDSIEKPYEVLEMPDIFSNNISSDELALLWNLEKETYTYSFENGFFKDIDWDSYGNPTILEWNLNFNVTSKLRDINNTTHLNIYIKIEKSPYGDFKISSIKKL